MTISNVNRDVSITTQYLNYPITCGISQNGYWYYYEPANIANTSLGASIKPYKWAVELPILGSTPFLQMEGTMPIITETWAGSPVKYHGGVIEWIGAGVNNITGTQETDAFFFSHLGALTASDDVFYWDRAYLSEDEIEWQYYQYHKHSPTNYVQYENGRQTTNGRGFIVPEDKSFGYQINTTARIMSVDYASIMARIHTPSIGGAHNSHNDITLPSIGNLNYLPGGMIRGSSNKFHVFYIRADGSNWKLLSRTYLASTGGFTIETDLGTYDFADPSFNPSSNIQSLYPFRASVGALFGTNIYIPVILNNSTSGFDLEVWSFPSTNNLSSSGLIRYPIITGVSVRPDMILKQYGSKIFGAYTDVVSGGIRIKSFDNVTETDHGLIVTNNASDYLRIHGLEANSFDGKFYVLLSGTSSNTGTYTGPGLYSFTIDELFQGYKHLDFDTTNYAFINRNPNTAGYVRYQHSIGGLTRVNNTEPSGIAEGTSILEYSYPSPNFINRKETLLGGDEFYYAGIQLTDGRRMFAGQIANNHDNLGIGGDFLVTIFSDATNGDQGEEHTHHFAWGGRGDDYITGLYESNDSTKVWITGYTKSTLTPREDIKIHGWTRNTSDGSNLIEWKDLVIDTLGNIYITGKHSDEYIIVSKFDNNYNFLWQKKIDETGIDTAHSIAIDSSNNIYVVGGTTSFGAGNTDAILVKLNPDGTILYTKTYGTNSLEYASSIKIVTKDTTEYIVLSIISGTSTIFTTCDLVGNIIEQNIVPDLITSKINIDTNFSTDGRILFAGNDGNTTTSAIFGLYEILSTGHPIKWISAYNTNSVNSTAYEIKAITSEQYAIVGSESTFGYILKINVTEIDNVFTVTKSWSEQIENSEFLGLTVTSTLDIIIVGYNTASGDPKLGMEDCLLAKWSNTGSLIWKNVYGHDMDERFVAVINDRTGENAITVGWSESHSFGRDGILFRFPQNGFGTGYYHLEGSIAVGYWYVDTTVSNTVNINSLTNLSIPTITLSSLTTTIPIYTTEDVGYTVSIYDGSYGPDGVFNFFVGYIDLEAIQVYLNSDQHRLNEKNNIHLDYTGDIFKFWEISTVGDGISDDGNVFGYDVVQATDGYVYCVGATSGDLTMKNTGISGSYDYIIVKFDPITEELEIYQNGTSLDEEVYACCMLSDGRLAYTGRTTGDLASPNEGGYDIFLGIFDPLTDTSEYYSIGSGFDDTGVNIHDLGSNELAIVYSTFGVIGNATSTGTGDIGVVKFNYDTNTWGNAYQTGSTVSEIFNQNGKPSVLLEDLRIAIVCSSPGVFADTNISFGLNDVCLGILDIPSGTWTKFQIGTGASDFGTTVFSSGDRLLIGGYSDATFADGRTNGIFVEFDTLAGISAKNTVESSE